MEWRNLYKGTITAAKNEYERHPEVQVRKGVRETLKTKIGRELLGATVDRRNVSFLLQHKK